MGCVMQSDLPPVVTAEEAMRMPVALGAVLQKEHFCGRCGRNMGIPQDGNHLWALFEAHRIATANHTRKDIRDDIQGS
jgi:hypothetical protein